MVGADESSSRKGSTPELKRCPIGGKRLHSERVMPASVRLANGAGRGILKSGEF
jgi:hypothetical protein